MGIAINIARHRRGLRGLRGCSWRRSDGTITCTGAGWWTGWTCVVHSCWMSVLIGSIEPEPSRVLPRRRATKAHSQGKGAWRGDAGRAADPAGQSSWASHRSPAASCLPSRTPTQHWAATMCRCRLQVAGASKQQGGAERAYTRAPACLPGLDMHAVPHSSHSKRTTFWATCCLHVHA